jgi:predicted porin
MLKYDAASWGAALAIDEIRGAPGAFAGLASSELKDTRISANGYVKLSNLKLSAGLLRRDNEGNPATPRSDMWYLGAAYSLTPAFALDGQLHQLRFKDSANKATLLGLRGTYSFSKRTALYATVGHIRNRGSLALSVSGGAPGANPLAGDSQTGVMIGMRHAF